MDAGTPVIRTPDQRLRVFVSSTLQELAPERAAATEAIRSLKLTPVLFELGARPHPPRQLYRAYLEQSHVFVGVYGERYGWIAPDMEISGLEDEYQLSGDRPKLIYVKEPASGRDDRLTALLQRIEEHNRACYKMFSSPDELRTMLSDDLAVLLSERFETAGGLPVARPGRAGAPAAARWLTRIGVALAAVVAAVAALLWLGARAARPPGGGQEAAQVAGPAAVAEPTSIAVLPFVNMSPDPDQEYFSDGLSEELLNVLAKVPQLRVISRTSSFQFKGKSEDVRTISQRLNVAHVLEGSVRKSGDRIRITAQLVSAADGSHEWSETYDRRLDDIFAVQDEIAARVVKELQVRLLQGALPQRVPPRNSEAYTLVLRARYSSDRRTQEDSARAVDYLMRALELDPNYAVAWAELARAYATQAGSGFAPVDESVANARRAAERALALDPGLASAHAMIGWIKRSHDWDWAAADESFKRALALSPGSAGLLGNAATMSRTLGRFDESIELIRRGIARDPLQGLLHASLAISLLYADRPEEAEDACRKAIELRPEAASQRYLLSRTLLAQGKLEAAHEEVERERDEGWRLTGQVLVYHALGRGAESDAALRDLTEGFAADMPYQIAEAHAYRGEIDLALDWLERARALHDTGLSELKGDPLLRNLEGDPRYREFLRTTMRLPV